MQQSLLLQHLESMDVETRAKRIDSPSEMPSEGVCCRVCEKAKWVVMDRQLSCYCPDTGKISWASRESKWSVETTMCEEVYAQEAKKMLAKKEQAQEPGQRPALRGHYPISL